MFGCNPRAFRRSRRRPKYVRGGTKRQVGNSDRVVGAETTRKPLRQPMWNSFKFKHWRCCLITPGKHLLTAEENWLTPAWSEGRSFYSSKEGKAEANSKNNRFQGTQPWSPFWQNWTWVSRKKLHKSLSILRRARSLALLKQWWRNSWLQDCSGNDVFKTAIMQPKPFLLRGTEPCSKERWLERAKRKNGPRLSTAPCTKPTFRSNAGLGDATAGLKQKTLIF